MASQLGQEKPATSRRTTSSLSPQGIRELVFVKHNARGYWRIVSFVSKASSQKFLEQIQAAGTIKAEEIALAEVRQILKANTHPTVVGAGWLSHEHVTI